MFTHGHSRIVGVGVYTPEKCVASSEIMEYLDSENRFGIATDWLEKVMGVRERRVSPDDWLPSDLAVLQMPSTMLNYCPKILTP
jgi:3-oxoacyl-[acyl-carrier-protein] synthase III